MSSGAWRSPPAIRSSWRRCSRSPGTPRSSGTDSKNGIALAIDYLDGTFDGTPGQLLGHDVTLQHEDDGCSAEGGQAGATALAANPDIVAVIGT